MIDLISSFEDLFSPESTKPTAASNRYNVAIKTADCGGFLFPEDAWNFLEPKKAKLTKIMFGRSKSAGELRSALSGLREIVSIEIAKNISDEMVLFGDGISDYTEIGIYSAMIPGHDNLQSAIGISGDSTSIATVIHLPNGDIVNINHVHGEVTADVSSCTPTAVALVNRNSKCRVLTAIPFFKCLGYNSKTCGGWNVAVARNESTVLVPIVPVHISQTIGIEPGKLKMVFTFNERDKLVPITVIFQAPRCGPLMNWVGPKTRKFMIDTVFNKSAGTGAGTGKKIKKTVKTALVASDTAVDAIVERTLDMLFSLSMSSSSVIDDVKFIETLNRWIENNGDGGGVSREIEWLHGFQTAQVSNKLKTSANNSENLMKSFSPKEDIAGEILRRSRSAVLISDRRRRLEMHSFEKAVNGYSGARWNPSLFSSDVFLGSPFQKDGLQDLIEDVMRRRLVEPTSLSSTVAVTTAATKKHKYMTDDAIAIMINGEVPSISVERAKEFVAAGFTSMEDLESAAASSKQTPAGLEYHEKTAILYRAGIFKPIPLSEITDVWKRVFTNTVFGGVNPEELMCCQQTPIRWTFSGKKLWGVDIDESDSYEWSINVLFLSDTTYSMGSGVAAPSFESIRASLRGGIVGDLSEDGTIFAVAPDSESPVRAIRLIEVHSKKEWPFRLTRELLGNDMFARLAKHAFATSNIRLSQNGVSFDGEKAGAGADQTTTTAIDVTDVFRLAGKEFNRASSLKAMIDVLKSCKLPPIKKQSTSSSTPPRPKMVMVAASPKKHTVHFLGEEEDEFSTRRQPLNHSFYQVIPIEMFTSAAFGALNEYSSTATSPSSAVQIEIETRFNNVTPYMFYNFVNRESERSSNVEYEESTTNVFGKSGLRVTRFTGNSNVHFVKKTQGLTVANEDIGIRTSISIEESISLNKLPPNGSSTGVRTRKRWTFRHGGHVRIDATVVETFSLKERERVKKFLFRSHEIEVEISNSSDLPLLNNAVVTVLHSLYSSPCLFSMKARADIFNEFNFSLNLPPPSRQEVKRSFPVESSEFEATVAVSRNVIAKPRNLQKRDLTLDGLGGAGPGGPYYAAVKADGVTSFLIVGNTGIWMIEPPDVASLIIPTTLDSPFQELNGDGDESFYHEVFGKTFGLVVIGERIPKENQLPAINNAGVVFSPFDVVGAAYSDRDSEGPCVDSFTYSQRFEYAVHLCKLIERQLADYRPSVSPVIKFLFKHIHLVSPPDISGVSAAITAAKKEAKTIGFANDGIMFTPENSPPNGGVGASNRTYDQTVLSISPDVCKYKPWEELTIDFKVTFSTKTVETISPITLPDGKKGSALIPFEGTHAFPFVAATDIDWDHSFFTMNAATSGRGTASSLIDGSIIEFGPVKTRSTTSTDEKIILEPRRMRLDKESPNGTKVAIGVWKLVNVPIPVEIIEESSSNFGLLFTFMNSVKSSAISKVLSGDRRGGSGGDRTIIIDIGSGNGGDLSKFVHHNDSIERLIMVEPDIINFKSLEGRAAAMFPIEFRNKIITLNVAAEDTDVIIDALKSSIEAASARGIMISAVNVTAMLSLSFFWKDSQSIGRLGNTLAAIRTTGINSTGNRNLPVVLTYITIEGSRTIELLKSNKDGVIRSGPLYMRLDEDDGGDDKKKKNSVYVEISGTIVRGQTEYLVYLDRLSKWCDISVGKSSSTAAHSSPSMLSKVDGFNFLSQREKTYGGLFVYGSCEIIDSSPDEDEESIVSTTPPVQRVNHARDLMSIDATTMFNRAKEYVKTISLSSSSSSVSGGIYGIFSPSFSTSIDTAGYQYVVPHSYWQNLVAYDGISLIFNEHERFSGDPNEPKCLKSIFAKGAYSREGDCGGMMPEIQLKHYLGLAHSPTILASLIVNTSQHLDFRRGIRVLDLSAEYGDGLVAAALAGASHYSGFNALASQESFRKLSETVFLKHLANLSISNSPRDYDPWKDERDTTGVDDDYNEDPNIVVTSMYSPDTPDGFDSIRHAVSSVPVKGALILLNNDSPRRGESLANVFWNGGANFNAYVAAVTEIWGEGTFGIRCISLFNPEDVPSFDSDHDDDVSVLQNFISNNVTSFYNRRFFVIIRYIASAA